MSKLKEDMEKLSINIAEIWDLSKCLYQSIDLCQRDNDEEYSHILPLAKIITDKCENLFDGYDDFENIIYNDFIWN